MKLVQSPIFWLVAISLIVIGLAVAKQFARRREPGFRDFVQNPQLWDDLLATREKVDREVNVAHGWNDEQIAIAVRRFVFDAASSRAAWADAKVLEGLGARTHSVLLELLRDRSVHTRLLKPKPPGPATLPEAPFNQVCDLLGESPPAESVSLLEPFLDDPSEEIRKDAALVLASVGTESIVLPVQKALRDSDEYVRVYALMGLQRAIAGQRLSRVCHGALFKNLQSLLSEGKNGSAAAGLLLHFDEPRATEFFLSEAMFTPTSASLHDCLHALNAKGLMIPRNRLLSLIEQLETGALKYPQTYQLGEALRSLGKHQLSEDSAILETRMSHAEDIVAEGAAAGMLALHRLDGFQERIWAMIEEQGIDALTAPQRRYNAVLGLNGEVDNGGLSQYFFNSSGDEWQAALAGLEAMEFRDRLEILREALAKFGTASPSENRDERMTQLSKLARVDKALFDELDSRYYKSTEIVDVMATRYVIKNPEAFR